MIAAENHPVQIVCKVLGVSESGYYERLTRRKWKRTLPIIVRWISLSANSPGLAQISSG